MDKNRGCDVVGDWILRYIGPTCHMHLAPVRIPPTVYRQLVLRAVCSAYRPSTSVRTLTFSLLQFFLWKNVYVQSVFESQTFHRLWSDVLDFCLMDASGTTPRTTFSIQFCLDPPPPCYSSCTWIQLTPFLTPALFSKCTLVALFFRSLMMYIGKLVWQLQTSGYVLSQFHFLTSICSSAGFWSVFVHKSLLFSNFTWTVDVKTSM